MIAHYQELGRICLDDLLKLAEALEQILEECPQHSDLPEVAFRANRLDELAYYEVGYLDASMANSYEV